jgi:hypothetical protein
MSRNRHTVSVKEVCFYRRILKTGGESAWVREFRAGDFTGRKICFEPPPSSERPLMIKWSFYTTKAILGLHHTKRSFVYSWHYALYFKKRTGKRMKESCNKEQFFHLFCCSVSLLFFLLYYSVFVSHRAFFNFFYCVSCHVFNVNLNSWYFMLQTNLFWIRYFARVAVMGLYTSNNFCFLLYTRNYCDSGKKINLEIMRDLYVFSIPEYGKLNFGFMSCLYIFMCLSRQPEQLNGFYQYAVFNCSS